MSSLQEKINRLLRFEPIVFLVLLAIHLLVLLRYEWYPTLDGPAHLYNAHLIKQLLLGNDHLAQFLEFSSFPEPNWSGHAIMAVLSIFLPANWVEKLLVAFIFSATAIGFRYCWRTHGRIAPLGSLLIFPFLAPYTFRIGFFNFSISIALLFFFLGLYSTYRNVSPLKRMLVLSALLGSIYFSNALTTLVAIAGMVLFTLVDLARDRSSRSTYLRRGIEILLISLPWIILIGLFVLRHSAGTTAGRLPLGELWPMWRDARIFPFQDGGLITAASRTIIGLLLVLALLTVVGRFHRNEHFKIAAADVWLLLSALSFLGFLVLPDKAASGSIISIRYLLFFHLFLALWLACQRWSVWMNFLIVPYLIGDLLLVREDHRYTAELSDDVQETRSVLPHIADRAIILPILYTDNWLHSNFSNYLGTERGILVIDNYEAMTPHFPLRWKTDHRAPDLVRSFYNSNRPCIDIDALGDSVALRFDHVTRWEFRSDIDDSCSVDLARQLSAGFELKHRSPQGRMELFRRDQY